MPKLNTGKLGGRHTLAKFSASQLETWADKLDSQVFEPENRDDPRWLKHWSDRMRRLAKDKRHAAQTKRLARRNPR